MTELDMTERGFPADFASLQQLTVNARSALKLRIT